MPRTSSSPTSAPSPPVAPYSTKRISESVLRIPFENSNPRAKEKPQADLLLHITNSTQCSSKSASTPDIQFLATDGLAAFSGALYYSRLGKYLAKGDDIDQGSDHTGGFSGNGEGLSISQFEAVLGYLFFRTPVSENKTPSDGTATTELLRGLSLTATWSEDDTRDKHSRGITLRFTRRVNASMHSQSYSYSAPITLASIPLSRDAAAEDKLDMCEWVRLAISQRGEAEREIAELRRKVLDAEKAVDVVKDQVTALVEARGQDQEVLLQSVVKLVNSKKARIRKLESEARKGTRTTRPWREIAEEVSKDEEDIKLEDADGDEVIGNANQNDQSTKGKGKGKGKGKAKVPATRQTTARTRKPGPSRTNKRKQDSAEIIPDGSQPEHDLEVIDADGEDAEDAGQEQEYNTEEEEALLREDFENADTDRDSINGDGNGNGMEDEDDHSHAGKGKGKEKGKGNTKQHALRSKQSQGQPQPEFDLGDDMSTDDEL